MGNGGGERWVGTPPTRLAPVGRQSERGARSGATKEAAEDEGERAGRRAQRPPVRHSCSPSSGREAGKTRSARGLRGSPSSAARRICSHAPALLFQYFGSLLSYLEEDEGGLARERLLFQDRCILLTISLLLLPRQCRFAHCRACPPFFSCTHPLTTALFF